MIKEARWLIGLLVIVVARCWNLVTPNKAAREYILRDFIQNGQETAFLSALKRGSLLLWDATGGTGWLLNGGMGLFYPLDLLYLTFLRDEFIVHHVFQYMLVFHIWLMGAFAYFLLRELGAARLSALAAGLVYSFNGYTVVHSMQLGLINTMTWLPLVFMLLERARREARWLPAAWAGVALGVGVLAAHAQIYYYMALAAVVYAAFWTIVGWRSSAGVGSRLRPLAQLAVLGLVTFGVSSIQTIPAFWAGVGSVHATAADEFKWRNPLSYYQLAMFVIPWGLDAVEDWNILVSERYAYMGWATLVFGLGALVWRREAKTYAYAAIAGIALILALGDNSFLFKFFYDFVPGYGMFRYPSRVLVLFVFAMTVLAGLGLDRFVSSVAGGYAREQVPRLLKILALGGAGVWLVGIAALTATIGTPVHDRLMHFVSQATLSLIVVWLWWGIVAIGRDHFQTRGFAVGLIAVLLFDLWSPGGLGERVPSPDRLKPEEEAATAFLKERKLTEEDFRIENHLLRESLLPRHQISAYNTESRMMGGDYLALMWAAAENPRILDLLNVRYVVGSRSPVREQTRANRDTHLGNLDLGPYGTKTLHLSRNHVRSGRIEMVSKIRFGGHIPQGELLGELEVGTTTGGRMVFPIRAGIETADWAAASPKARVRHKVATVADSWSVENKDEKYEGHSYSASFALSGPQETSLVELRYLRSDAQIEIDRLIAGGRDLTKLPEDRFERLSPEIIRNRYALERAFLVPEASVIADPEEMKRAVRWFDPGRLVLLSKQAPLPKAEQAVGAGRGRAKVVSYSSWKIAVDVETPAPQYLVLSDTFHPWWRARIDGKRVEVLRANMALRAVVIPAGTHTVEFYMVPVSFYAGAGVTVLTLAALGGLAVRSRRKIR